MHWFHVRPLQGPPSELQNLNNMHSRSWAAVPTDHWWSSGFFILWCDGWILFLWLLLPMLSYLLVAWETWLLNTSSILYLMHVVAIFLCKFGCAVSAWIRLGQQSILERKEKFAISNGLHFITIFCPSSRLLFIMKCTSLCNDRLDHWTLTETISGGLFHVQICRGAIVLIPKKGSQLLLSNKWLLTLLNTIYKIFAKVYQLRLTSVQRFISHHQSAFLSGRSIHHSILLTNELLHRAMALGVDHILFKLDICKAFDKLEWDFLYWLLQHIGFGPKFIAFVKALSVKVS